jgi:hypothetical protein
MLKLADDPAIKEDDTFLRSYPLNILTIVLF